MLGGMRHAVRPRRVTTPAFRSYVSGMAPPEEDEVLVIDDKCTATAWRAKADRYQWRMYALLEADMEHWERLPDDVETVQQKL